MSMRSFFSGLVVGAAAVFLLCSFHYNTILMKHFRSMSQSSPPQESSSSSSSSISVVSSSQPQPQQQQHLRSSSSSATESSTTTDSGESSSIINDNNTNNDNKKNNDDDNNDDDKKLQQLQQEQQEQSRSKEEEKKFFYDDDYDVCVVGAGLSGAVIAERYSSQLNSTILIVEKRNHIGGNCYDYIDDDTGVRVSKYGAHLFHTVSDRVWQYVQQFSHWTKYEHEVVGIVDGKHVPIPVNINTVNMLFNLTINSTTQMDEWLSNEQIKYDHEPTNSEEMALSRVGPRLFKSIFEPYTIKQWAKHPRELGPEVTARYVHFLWCVRVCVCVCVYLFI